MINLDKITYVIDIEKLKSNDSIPFLYLKNSLLIDKYLYCTYPNTSSYGIKSVLSRNNLTNNFLSKSNIFLMRNIYSSHNNLREFNLISNNIEVKVLLESNQIFFKINDIILMALCVRAESLFNYLNCALNAGMYNFSNDLFYVHINNNILKSNGLNNILKPFGFSDRVLYNFIIKQWIPLFEKNNLCYKIEQPIIDEKIIDDRTITDFNSIVNNNFTSKNISDSLINYLNLDKHRDYYKINELLTINNNNHVVC